MIALSKRIDPIVLPGGNTQKSCTLHLLHESTGRLKQQVGLTKLYYILLRQHQNILKSSFTH